MMRIRSDPPDNTYCTHNNIKYCFDRKEPGYTPKEMIVMTLTHELKSNEYPVVCALCNITPVYFSDEDCGNPNNYICNICYNKIKN